MSTVEDFESAPVGAAATREATGSRAMKMDDGEQGWIVRTGFYLDNEEMVFWGYALDPATPATAREALDLAWELAHEVKEGQVIPKGNRYLELHGSRLREYTAPADLNINSVLAPITRTLKPLPDPEPDWLDAPAVLAVCNDRMDRSVFVREGDNWWVSKNYSAETRDLRDVTPLYPRETNS